MSISGFRPLSPAALAREVSQRCLATQREAEVLRVAVDGADAAVPGALADAVAALLREQGRPCVRVSLAHWLRPASVRLEHGHTDPESYRHGWFDLGALGREVLDPLGPSGDGQWLPTLWDSVRDRATRARREQAGPATVLLVDGPMLLGRSLPFELTVHLHLSAAALHRRTPPEQRWTLPVLLEHENEARTDDAADLLVRADHADRPALRAR